MDTISKTYRKSRGVLYYTKSNKKKTKSNHDLLQESQTSPQEDSEEKKNCYIWTKTNN